MDCSLRYPTCYLTLSVDLRLTGVRLARAKLLLTISIKNVARATAYAHGQCLSMKILLHIRASARVVSLNYDTYVFVFEECVCTGAVCFHLTIACQEHNDRRVQAVGDHFVLPLVQNCGRTRPVGYSVIVFMGCVHVRCCACGVPQVFFYREALDVVL